MEKVKVEEPEMAIVTIFFFLLPSRPYAFSCTRSTHRLSQEPSFKSIQFFLSLLRAEALLAYYDVIVENIDLQAVFKHTFARPRSHFSRLEYSDIK